MRKIKFLLPLGLLLAGACTSSKNRLSDTAKENIEAMHGIFNCFNTGDFSKLGKYIAEDCIDHASGTKEDIRGLSRMKANYEEWMQMVANSSTTIRTELANDDYVIAWVSFNMTMKTDVANKTAGEKFDKNDVEMLRFKDGKAVEHWTFIDAREMDKVLSASNQQ